MKTGSMKKYAYLIRKVAQEVNDERASKCGYDLMMGLEKGNHKNRAEAWERYINELKDNDSHTDEERDGCWVPAIPVKM